MNREFQQIYDLLTLANGRDSSEPAGASALSKKVLLNTATALLVGVGYYMGTVVGFALTPKGQPNSTFWPPNAILLAAFLLAPQRMWWAFLGAVFPAHMLVQLRVGVPIWTAVGWFITNTSEAFIGAFFISQFTRRKEVFETVRGVFMFVMFGVLMAPFATSFLDAAAVVITGWGHGYWPLEAERFWTNALAELTIVPAIVLCFQNWSSWRRKVALPRILEAGTLALAVASTTVLAFGLVPIPPSVMPALLYVPLPLLLWATLRFGAAGLSVSVLGISLISLWHTMHGQLPFPSASLQQNVLSLQILLSVVVVPLMFLSAVTSEVHRVRDTLQTLSGGLIDAQEQERRRIARDLHDDLGQQIALAQCNVDESIGICELAVKPNLMLLSRQISTIADSAREISRGLYPGLLEAVGFESALKKLCREIARGEPMSIRLDIRNAIPKGLDRTASLCLYRVAQEALHNVIAHSQGTQAVVELMAREGDIVLRILDDGVGFDRERVNVGLGLQSMRERVRSVDGSIDILSSPKMGTRIEVRVPIGRSKVE